MSRTETANVELHINGKQAQRVLQEYEKSVENARKEVEKLEAANADPAKIEKARKKYERLKKDLEQMKTAANGAASAISDLDKATPKMIEKRLKQLKKELKDIEPYSESWKAHTAEIKLLNDKMKELNDSMREQPDVMEHVNKWWEKFQMVVMAAVAAVTGLILAGKKAVAAYAEMEQEMANVRKYTGLTTEEVELLNEEFQKMDTRTSRIELNKLAQEAGRLGKTSVEDVLGFVKAADKINVALDDLGSGATLELSKLTGIFGDEKRLGTERSLLAVGSVINELSQNCSASAPYLADFASRIGGVGAQAGMTVQQIMGMAAVLDSNNQKVEASATAISQVITRMYQDPAKYAAPAGLNVQKFADLLKKDANEALLVLMERLNELGSMDVLAPIFKDMGENGSRAISALATLAGNIDMVRQQQLAANEAFSEAVSIDKEFEVQNNTVQAQFDKAKESLHNLMVELGEKLQPIMSHVISSSTIMLKTLKTIVEFIIKNKTELAILVSAIALYNIIVNAAAIRTAAAAGAHALWSGTLKMFPGIVNVCKLAVAAMTNAVQYLTNGLEVNYAMQQRWQAALSRMSLANWVGLVLAAVSAVAILMKRFRDNKRAVEEARLEQERYKRSLIDTSEKESDLAAKELARLEALNKVASNESKSREERLKAINKMRQLYPDYFKDVKTETDMLNSVAGAYERIKNSILEAAKARAAQDLIEDNTKKLLELMKSRDEVKRDLDSHSQSVEDFQEYLWAKNKQSPANSYNVNGNYNESVARKAVKAQEKRMEEYGSLSKKIKEIEKANDFLMQFVKTDNIADDYNNLAQYQAISDVTSDDGGTGSGKGDRFKEEKDWKLRAEAINRINYARGFSVNDGVEQLYTIEDYKKRSLEIEKEFIEMKMRRKDLTDDETLQLTADLQESLKKINDTELNFWREHEDQRHREAVAGIKDEFLSGTVSLSHYLESVEKEEDLHNKRLIELAKEGSKERFDLENEMREKELQNAVKSKKEYEAIEKEAQKRLDQIRNDHFRNPKDRDADAYADELLFLDTVFMQEIDAAGDNAVEKLRIEEAYQKAKLALMKKYNQEGYENEKSALEKVKDDFINWLESDGGKAVTSTADSIIASMSAIFSQLSSLVQYELEAQTNAIESRYEREIEAAQGNSYRIAKLEKQRDKEIAAAKNEANKKMFSMQVIQAVAQTAQNALNAYGSAAAIPMVGYIIAPIAAAAAVAAGMLQVAAIKKQQAAASAQGYYKGGFTKPGDVNEPAGVVHAGEWVASQRLLKDPVARPLINMLDSVQRNNTYGRLRQSDVSAAITANQSLSRWMGSDSSALAIAKAIGNSTAAMVSLKDKLDEPIVAHATIAGDYGINKKQEEYARLLRNVTPKSKIK